MSERRGIGSGTLAAAWGAVLGLAFLLAACGQSASPMTAVPADYGSEG